MRRSAAFLPVDGLAGPAPAPRRPGRLAAAAASLLLAGCGPATTTPSAPAPAPPTDYDAGIEAAYVTQGVQDLRGAVPLLSGRAGLLRIFLRSSLPGLAPPVVEASLRDTASGAELGRFVASSALAALPAGLFEGARGGSWDVALPGELLQPGRHLELSLGALAGLDPSGIRDALRLPAAGSLDVRPAAPLRVTLVPVVQSGLRPDVTTSRSAEDWVALARLVLPVSGAEVAVDQPYQTSQVLGADGAGWSELLEELERRRVDSGSTAHHLGVVHLGYASGTGGRGLVGGRSALVADLPGLAERLAAHELGHNLGLRHAPCGVGDPASLDPAWPAGEAYLDAHTGVFGWDPRDGALLDPAATYDVMSYCGEAGSTWVSDYGYRRALEGPSGAPAARLEAAPSAGTAWAPPCQLEVTSGPGGQGRLRPATRSAAP